MIGIYKITSPSNKIYIGQSINIESRFNNYKNLRCKNQKRLYYSLKKHGVEKHKFEIIAECSIDNLNNIERYYQDLYSSTGKKGLNCLLTKSFDKSGRHSEATILKFKEKRRYFSEETRLKMSQSQKGRKHSEITKRKMSQNMKGIIFSDETRKRMSISAKGKPNSDKQKEKVSVLVLDNSTGIFYNSILEASIAFGFKYSTLKAKLCGQNKNNTNLIKLF